MELKNISLVIAAATAAVIVASGFQAGGTKTGTVDIARVFNESDFAKKQQDALRSYGESRSSLLDFLENFRVATPVQAEKLKALMLKEVALTDAEKADLEATKKAVQEDDAKLKGLQTKTNLTPAEVATLNELNSRSQVISNTLQKWQRDFEEDIRVFKDKLRADTLDRVQKAIKDVGTKQGYSVIFSSETAPYSANDITAEALKSANAAK
jgi:Skp family chaperone for outer membrane proteins